MADGIIEKNGNPASPPYRSTDGYTWDVPLSFGTTSAPLSVTASSPVFEVNTTSAITSGQAESLTINQTMTAAASGNTVEVGRFILTSDVKTGAWANAVLAKIDYSTDGLAHGLAGVVCAEIDLPGSSVVRGTYAVFEAEINCPANCAMNSNPIHVFQINSWGNQKAQFDTVGYLFQIDGTTAAADTTKLISSVSLAELPSGTIGVRVKHGATVYRIPLVLNSAWN